jgi:mono/diheme cytochrome c family protein
VLLASLTSTQKLGIALMAAAFIVFALVSAFVLPRRNPDFPGRRHIWLYVGVVACFFAGMMSVIVFVDREPAEAQAKGPTTPTSTAPKPPTPPAAKGNAAAGKALFTAQGCIACHTFRPAGSTGTIGPNLDNVAADAQKANRGSLAQYVTESIVDPNAYIVPKYSGSVMPQDFGKKLSSKQIADLVAFVTQASS